MDPLLGHTNAPEVSPILTVQSPKVAVLPLEAAGITPDPENLRLHTARNIGVIEDSLAARASHA